MGNASSMTRNQELVFDVLSKSEAPKSAYTILDELRSEGLRAPLQIYRALDALIASGSVHKLESLNAYVACSHPACGDHSDPAHAITAFMICDECKSVSEVTEDDFINELKMLAEKTGFRVQKSILEVHGTCARCQP